MAARPDAVSVFLAPGWKTWKTGREKEGARAARPMIGLDWGDRDWFWFWFVHPDSRSPVPARSRARQNQKTNRRSETRGPVLARPSQGQEQVQQRIGAAVVVAAAADFHAFLARCRHVSVYVVCWSHPMSRPARTQTGGLHPLRQLGDSVPHVTRSRGGGGRPGGKPGRPLGWQG